MQKKKIFRIVVFILIVVSSDFIIGRLLKELYFTSSSKTYEKIRYTIDSTSQDILIYGSSRAEHHYIPDTISKYTGMSSYNCGVGGEGIVFSFIQISEMLKRQTPKLIILDIAPNILLDPLSDEQLKILNPYFDRDTLIFNALTNVSVYEKFKYYSSIYPFNGVIMPLLTSYISHLINYKKDIINGNGYSPVKGVFTSNVNVNNSKVVKIPDRQLYYLNRIIKICKIKNVILKFVVSPIFQKNNSDDIILAEIEIIAKKNDICFMNYSNEYSKLGEKKLFSDNLHLNYIGAGMYSVKFSNIIAHDISKKIISTKAD